MTVPVYRDVFEPVLVTPNPLDVSDEQKDFIREILRVSSSDSKFADKAYKAIMVVLLDEAVTPLIISIDPTEGHAGGGPLSVTITGENFEPSSVVLQAGSQIASSFVNDKELIATVLLSGAIEGTLAISVRNSSGLVSNTVTLTVLPPLSANDVAKLESGITASTTDNTREVPVATTEGESTTESEQTALDELKARINQFNASDAQDSGSKPTNQFDAEQSGGTPLSSEGAK